MSVEPVVEVLVGGLERGLCCYFPPGVLALLLGGGGFSGSVVQSRNRVAGQRLKILLIVRGATRCEP